MTSATKPTFNPQQIHTHQAELWKGHIPVQFNLLPSEAYHSTPPTVYKLLPRISYFGAYLMELQEHFKPYIREESSKDALIWLQVQGEPLKWNAPIGVLYDYLCGHQKSILDESNTNQQQTQESDSDVHSLVPQTPWKITVRFFGFPIDRVLELHSDEDFLWNYVNNLKESIYVQFNNTNPIMTCLSKDQQLEMWNAIKEVDYDRFSAGFERMIQEYRRFSATSSPSSPSEDSDDVSSSVENYLNGRKRIPIKIYRVDEAGDLKREVSELSFSVTSELHCVTRDNAVQLSVYEFFKRNPQSFPMDHVREIIIQGLHFPWTTEEDNLLERMCILDVYRSFCHPDQLLYITMVVEQKEVSSEEEAKT